MPPLVAGDHMSVEFVWTMPRLAPATYGLTLAVSDGRLDKYVICDWAYDFLSFSVAPGDEPAFGWIGLECEVDVKMLGASCRGRAPLSQLIPGRCACATTRERAGPAPIWPLFWPAFSRPARC